jgi:type VI protein secretion system component VasK
MMLPLTWFMWTGPGSGNANFFYNQTLFWLLCHFFLIVEVLGSVRRRHALRAVWQRQQQGQEEEKPEEEEEEEKNSKRSSSSKTALKSHNN